MRRGAWNPWLGQVALAGTHRRMRLGDVTGLNDDSFSQATDAPAAVVDFWSPSCLPCMKYKPIFEAVAAQPPGGVFMGTVNADESPKMMAYYGIDSIPATLFFVSGEEVYRTQGILQRQDLLDTIAKYIPSAAPSAPTDMTAPAQAPASTPAGAAQTVTPSQAAQPAPAGPAQRATPSSSAPSTAKAAPAKAPAAAPSSGPPMMTIFIGGIAVLAVTATVVLLSKD